MKQPLLRSKPAFVAGLLLAAAVAACSSEAPPPAAPAVEAPASVAAATTAPSPPSDAPTPPEGMVYVPGGTTRIGADPDDPAAQPTERPAFDAVVAPFFLDQSLVTLARFGAFVAAEQYTTEAERLGDAGVYHATAGWQLVPGATWQRPLGPDSPAAPADHPVTQVSWNDAVAFCEAAGGRLPTEIEWEHAARGGNNSRARYAWGDQLGRAHDHTGHGSHAVHANTSDADDGFALTSPVGAFGTTPLGLTDMGGNVWEWTADWFRPYAERDAPFTPTAASERVQRGGSFLCTARYCHGYRVSARSPATPETALFHTGFRCARDVPAPTPGT